MKLAFWKKSNKPKEIIFHDQEPEHEPHEESSLVKLHITDSMVFWLFILGVIGIIINCILLYSLHNKVTLMSKDNAITYDVMNKAARIMDQNSGTFYAKKITPDSLENKNTFNQSVTLIEKQASDLVKERDGLAKTLSSISEEIDVDNQQKESSLTDLSSYEKSSNTVAEMSKKSLDANSEFASCFLAIAKVLKVSIPNKSAFISASKLAVDQDVLKSVANEIASNYQQMNKLKNEIDQKDAKIAKLTASLKVSNSAEKNNDEFKELYKQQRKESELLRIENEELKNAKLNNAEESQSNSEENLINPKSNASLIEYKYATLEANTKALTKVSIGKYKRGDILFIKLHLIKVDYGSGIIQKISDADANKLFIISNTLLCYYNTKTQNYSPLLTLNTGESGKTIKYLCQEDFEELFLVYKPDSGSNFKGFLDYYYWK
ncbi:MAG: hypothetical protein WCR55_10310 [Lentisphaerota bacterium]